MSTRQTPHLDVETLADHQEGLLAAEQATAVAAHLAGCLDCRATRDALDGVQVLLREHGDEGPLAAPDDVVRRLDDALAAAGPPVASASATITPLTALTASTTRARAPWQTRALQAAAIFVLVAAVGGIGYGGIKALSGGHSAADTSASGTGTGKPPTERLAPGTYKFTDSGRDYTQASMRAAVPQLLAGSLPQVLHKNFAAGAAASPTPLAAGEGTHSGAVTHAGAPADPKRLLDGTALSACVANLMGGPVTPLAVDLGKFEGKPATIIVLPDPDDASFVNVYAVAPDCPTGTFLAWEHVAQP